MPAIQILTIGHSTRSAGDFLALLRTFGVQRLADIRTIPQSRRHPHFGREALDAGLAAEGLEYRHFPGLGGLRKPRSDSPNGAWKNSSFRGYADHMMTPEFSSAVNELLAFAESRTAVMCAEAVWWRCHRMLLSDTLVARGVDVQHIVQKSGSGTALSQPHRLTPFARIRDDGALWYPSLEDLAG